MYSPRPIYFVPDINNELVMNFVNNFGITSGSIPVPLSFILTIASIFFSFCCIRTVTEIVPFGSINFRALSNKLVNTYILKLPTAYQCYQMTFFLYLLSEYRVRYDFCSELISINYVSSLSDILRAKNP